MLPGRLFSVGRDIERLRRPRTAAAGAKPRMPASCHPFCSSCAGWFLRHAPAFSSVRRIDAGSAISGVADQGVAFLDSGHGPQSKIGGRSQVLRCRSATPKSRPLSSQWLTSPSRLCGNSVFVRQGGPPLGRQGLDFQAQNSSLARRFFVFWPLLR